MAMGAVFWKNGGTFFLWKNKTKQQNMTLKVSNPDVATKVYSDLERYAHRLTESDIDKYVGTPTATIKLCGWLNFFIKVRFSGCFFDRNQQYDPNNLLLLWDTFANLYIQGGKKKTCEYQKIKFPVLIFKTPGTAYPDFNWKFSIFSTS